MTVHMTTRPNPIPAIPRRELWRSPKTISMCGLPTICRNGSGGLWNGRFRRSNSTLIARLRREVGWQFGLAYCEVKSNWLRDTSACAKDSAFRNALRPEDIEDIAGAYFRQVAERKAVIPALVIDKRSCTTKRRRSCCTRKYTNDAVRHPFYPPRALNNPPFCHPTDDGL